MAQQQKMLPTAATADTHENYRQQFQDIVDAIGTMQNEVRTQQSTNDGKWRQQAKDIDKHAKVGEEGGKMRGKVFGLKWRLRFKRKKKYLPI